jgi:hypothetical protein
MRTILQRPEWCDSRATHRSAAFKPHQRSIANGSGITKTPSCLERRCGMNPALHRRGARALCVFAFALVALLFSFSTSALEISWTNNLLTVTGTNLPGGKLEVWYLEAFCRSGAHHRNWNQTTLPHKTTLLTNENNHVLRFKTTVQPSIEVNHAVTTSEDELDIRFTMKNSGSEDVDVQWFQPACIRVEKFTGAVQSNYIAKSFIFTERGLTTLDQTRRTEEAVYRGGQVYVIPGVSANDANPRPLCFDRPINGLIGCFSADGKQLLATASDRTHELFEGVYVCLHSDPRIDGLKAGESKTLHAKLYVMTNDVPALLRRYTEDFSPQR